MEGGGFIPEGEPVASAQQQQQQRRPAPPAAPRAHHDDLLLAGGRDASGCEHCGSLTFSQEWFNAFGVVICNQCKADVKLITKASARRPALRCAGPARPMPAA